MSMPSDVTDDVTEEMEKTRAAAVPRPAGGGMSLSPEQVGFAATALIVFLGAAVLGPAIARLRPRPPTLRERVQRAKRDARLRTEVAGYRTRRRVRQLGGGTIRL